MLSAFVYRCLAVLLGLGFTCCGLLFGLSFGLVWFLILLVVFVFRLLLWFGGFCSISCLSVCCFVLCFMVGGVWFGLLLAVRV